MSLLGLDWGARWVGYATSDDQGLCITPRGSFERKIPKDRPWQLYGQDLKHLKIVIEEWEITGLVFGIPLLAAGAPSPMGDALTQLAQNIAQTLTLELHYVNEHLSSWEASQLDYKTKNKIDDHARAAALILSRHFTGGKI